MRTRDLKPGFFKNEVLAELPYPTRLFFQGLWLCADREGRLEDRPAKLRAEILPYDMDFDAERAMADLAEKEFVVRYEAANRRWVQIVNFLRHQKPHAREQPSLIPPLGSLGQPQVSQGDAKAVPRPTFSPPIRSSLSSLSSLSAPLKKEEEKNKTPRILQPEALAAARLLSESVRMVNPKHRELQEPRIEGTLERWARDLDLLNRRDGQSWEDIERVIKWLPDDEFWPHVILSGRNVRKHWDKLWEKATRKGPADLAKLMKGLCKCPQ